MMSSVHSPRSWIALVWVLTALPGCDLISTVGGYYESDASVTLGGAAPTATPIRLVLGQYGDEVAGHLMLPGSDLCPCVYLKGDFRDDRLTFETEPGSADPCPLLSGVFIFHTDRLDGRLYDGVGTINPITPEVRLNRLRAQSDLSSEDLGGCDE